MPQAKRNWFDARGAGGYTSSVKLSLVKIKKLRPNRLAALFAVGIIFGITVGGLLFTVHKAQALAADENFHFALPYYADATQGTDVYMEISQTGDGNSLDAPEAWAKIYIDPDRLSEATIGIWRGGYANTEDGGDSEGEKFKGANGAFADNNTTRFEFYLGVDYGQAGFSDERPCREPATWKDSGGMSPTGWYKLDTDRFRGDKCGSIDWEPTIKTGKYVIFVRAFWKESNPLSSGRLNAFKVSGAYERPKSKVDNPITGYWSDYTAAIRSTKPTTASYSVQDRRSEDGSRGSYTFNFAPDCRIAPGVEDPQTRYLHWKDVDYPGFYEDKKGDPSFDLYEISPSGKERRMPEMHVDKNTRINGRPAFGQDVHGALPFKGKGGYKYEWRWSNVTRVDGVTFWLPYDDYPALAGCGSYEQSIRLKAGSNGTLSSTTPFRARGGQTVGVNLTETYEGGTSQVPTGPTTLTVSSAGGGPAVNRTFDSGNMSAPLSGVTKYNDPSAGLLTTRWTFDGLGPSPTYSLSRSFTTYYTLKEDAPDGARYCFNSTVSPESNTRPRAVSSNQVCMIVDNSLRPYVSTSGADVHAGDCSIQDASGAIIPGTGKIYGPPVTGRGSFGSYIVSANDIIKDFGSGGSPGGGALTFGKGGKYGTLCRPTIDAIETYFKADEAEAKLPDSSNTFNLSTLPAGGRYKVEFAGNGRLVGQSRATVTAYSKTGTITLDSSAGSTVGSDENFPAARGKLPVVGIVARDIKINPGVTKVNAALYAVYNIDTCAVSNWVAQCKNSLQISGFAMARDFSFKRISSALNGLQEGERIDFNAAFYLNAPPGLTDSTALIKYLGERAPLY